MPENEAFLVARRRNAHRRGGAAFLSELADRAGLGDAALIDAARSVPLERRVYGVLRAGIASGAVARHVHLPRAEAVALATRSLAPPLDRKVLVLLAHAPDFLFEARADAVLAALERLLEYDGDTVTMVDHDDARRGLCLDLETEGAPRVLCEVDVWGGPGGPCAGPFTRTRTK